MTLRGFALAAGLSLVLGMPSTAAEPLRVMSFNIHHGRGSDGKIDLDRIAGVIRQVSPHLVALQEVDRNTKRSGGVDQPAELARRTGLTAIFEKNIDFEGGAYGNAVLTSLDVVRHRNVHLPSLRHGEQRGVLVVTCSWPSGGGPLCFLATHFDYRGDDAERIESIKVVNRIADDAASPVILAGDLNALFDSREIRTLRSKWQLAHREPLFTFPADRPVRQIDYVLFRPAEAFRPIAARVLDAADASDHRPLYVELDLPAP